MLFRSTIEDPNTKQQTAQVIIQNALITDVGVATKVEDESSSGDFTESEAVPVTFSLTPEDSLKLAYAESFSKKVRLRLLKNYSTKQNNVYLHIFFDRFFLKNESVCAKEVN